MHIYFENLANELINIQFINAQGQHVKTMMLQSKVGANREDLNISDLQTGVYFVKINTSLGIRIKKIDC